MKWIVVFLVKLQCLKINAYVKGTQCFCTKDRKHVSVFIKIGPSVLGSFGMKST